MSMRASLGRYFMFASIAYASFKITVYIWNFRICLEIIHTKSFEIVYALRGSYLSDLFPHFYFNPRLHPVKAAGVLSPLFRQCVFDIHMVPTASGLMYCWAPCDCHILFVFVFCQKPPSSSPTSVVALYVVVTFHCYAVSIPIFFRNLASMLPLAIQLFTFMWFYLLSSFSSCSIANVQQVASKSSESLPVKRRVHPVGEGRSSPGGH